MPSAYIGTMYILTAPIMLPVRSSLSRNMRVKRIKKNSAYKIAREVAETRIEINETGGLVKKIVLLIIY